MGVNCMRPKGTYARALLPTLVSFNAPACASDEASFFTPLVRRARWQTLPRRWACDSHWPVNEFIYLDIFFFNFFFYRFLISNGKRMVMRSLIYMCNISDVFLALFFRNGGVNHIVYHTLCVLFCGKSIKYKIFHIFGGETPCTPLTYAAMLKPIT